MGAIATSRCDETQTVNTEHRNQQFETLLVQSCVLQERQKERKKPPKGHNHKDEVRMGSKQCVFFPKVIHEKTTNTHLILLQFKLLFATQIAACQILFLALSLYGLNAYGEALHGFLNTGT